MPAPAGAEAASPENFPTPAFEPIVPGLDAAEVKVRSIPARIQVVRVDPREPTLQIHATLGGGSVLGMSTVPAQARALAAPGLQPLAAVNGGYFRESAGPERGIPGGLLIVGGELICAPANTSFWVDDTNGLHIAVVRPKLQITWPDGSTSPCRLNELPTTNTPAFLTARFGGKLKLPSASALLLRAPDGSAIPPIRCNTTTSFVVNRRLDAGEVAIPRDAAVLLPSDAQSAMATSIKPGATLKLDTEMSQDLTRAISGVGAGPTLLTGGATNQALLRGNSPGIRDSREPRTAVGFNQRHAFFVVVDGRSLTSSGMTFLELAQFMAHLGCTDAMNLDGGKSTTLWLNGRVVNSPAGWLTPAVGDALVIASTNAPGRH